MLPIALMQVAAMPTEDWEPVQQQEKGGASVDPTADAPEGAAASGGSGDDGKLDESDGGSGSNARPDAGAGPATAGTDASELKSDADAPWRHPADDM